MSNRFDRQKLMGGTMPIFEVHRKLPGITTDGLGQAQKAAIEKSNEFSDKGIPVKYLRSQFDSNTDKCVCYFEANDVVSVKIVNEEAALPFDEIKEVVD